MKPALVSVDAPLPATPAVEVPFSTSTVPVYSGLTCAASFALALLEEELSPVEVLTPTDPATPAVKSCDASSYGGRPLSTRSMIFFHAVVSQISYHVLSTYLLMVGHWPEYTSFSTSMPLKLDASDAIEVTSMSVVT